MTGPRVVVVGNGMAGSRVVEDIRAADPGRLVDLTVVGGEAGLAYNRVLLSDVLARRHRADAIALTAPDWHERNGVALRSGSPAVGIDRAARVVTTADGQAFAYDVLVLATGSEPILPPVAGLTRDASEGSGPADHSDRAGRSGHAGRSDASDQLIPGAFVFRTLDDCAAIDAAARTATRAVVLGGGLLGIEAARGLAGRGLPVVVVHLAGHLMERQLDAAAGRVLARTLSELGVTVRAGIAAESVIRDGAGGFGGLTLGDGSCVLGDLLVVATGVRPEVGLARDAGLRVGRGVVVDDSMRSVTDPRVFAVGECAEHDGSVYGLVAPSWEQARVVASQVTGTDPGAAYRGSRLVTRLKASGIDLASFGDPFAEGDDLDVIQVADPGRGTYAKVTARDERIVGAIVLGPVVGIGTLTTIFDRDSKLPESRLGLLMPIDEQPGRVAAAPSPAAMPGGAIVCRCNGVTKAAIQACVLGGARSVNAVAAGTRATTGCGGCKDAVGGIVDWLNAAEPAVPQVLSLADATRTETPTGLPASVKASAAHAGGVPELDRGLPALESELPELEEVS